jgi:hypothetical protein
VTSATVKAYPPIQVSESTVTFVLPSNVTGPSNATVSNPSILSNVTFQPAIAKDLGTFWSGVNLVYGFGKDIVDNGGTTYSYLSSTGNNSFSFTTAIDLAGKSAQDTFDFVQPLFNSLNAIGIPVNNTTPTLSAR